MTPKFLTMQPNSATKPFFWRANLAVVGHHKPQCKYEHIIILQFTIVMHQGFPL